MADDDDGEEEVVDFKAGDAKLNEDGSTTLRILFPFKKTDGTTADEVNVIRPKVKNMKSSDGVKSEYEKSVMLICDLTGFTKSEASNLDLADFSNISRVVEGYIQGKPLKIGGK